MNKFEAKKVVDAHHTRLFNNGQVDGAGMKEYDEACKVWYGVAKPTAPADLANFTEGLSAVSGAELYERQFPPRQALVENLLYRSTLTILSAKPKSGKSWFVLQLAQAVDTGAPFLGRKATKGKVLYLALEDGERRIHERMHVRNWVPKNTNFVFGVLPFDGDGAGIDQVIAASAAYDLIVIDTFIATLTSRTNENDNAQMAEIINRLQRFARDSDKAAILNHHLTKGKTEDPFDAVRGGGAIRAAYDVGLVLERKGKEREAVLRTETRDIPLEDMTIMFDGSTGWSYQGDAAVYEGITAGRKVVTALSELHDRKSTDEIAKHLGISYQAALGQLTRAEARKLVSRESRKVEGKDKPIDLWSLVE